MIDTIVTEVDCALLMMLDEERDLFLQQNSQLIVEKVDDAGFIDFTFFDKKGILRKGVIFSKGKKMGNTEACKMFYQFSRRYKAHLYINLGVAGFFKDINIGDVLIAEQLSTLGENNATNVPWQSEGGRLRNVPNLPDSNAAYWVSFKENSKKRLEAFYKKLRAHPKFTENDFSYLMKEKYNKVKKGGCITVPEVIKGGRDRFPQIRTGNVVDMEAYYLYDWHELIKEIEPLQAIEKSAFLCLKSVSDMADENKSIVEECGSRTLAMANLCDVVCTYLTTIHNFTRNEEETIYSYFHSTISNRSLDPLFLKDENGVMEKKFGNLCKFFMNSSSSKGIISEEDAVVAAYHFLSKPKKTLVLSGHSGTGKSTFISYVYSKISKERQAILIDFSKFNEFTIPTNRQVVFLLKQLLSQENPIAVFLDGISVNDEIYDLLLNALHGKAYANLSLCIGDITEGLPYSMNTTVRNPDDLLPRDATIERYSFGGISVYSPHLQPLLKGLAEYFDGIQEGIFKADEVLQYMHDSHLSHVDFRLLKMFSDNWIESNFYKFMDKYCAQKEKRAIYSELYSHVPFTLHQNQTLNDEEKRAYRTLNQNSYTRAYLFANCIAGIVIDGKKEKIVELLKSDYILSNDMNLLLKLKLEEAATLPDIFIENLLPLLSNQEVATSQSAQTQLFYNIFQIKPHSLDIKTRRKKLLLAQVKYAKEQWNRCESSGKDYYHWSLQYRTLSILMWYNLDEHNRKRDFLDEYNQLLLTNSEVHRHNLFFHFYHYSYKEFTFKQVNSFELSAMTDEMFFNTYYTLIYALRDENIDDVENCFDPFVCMNIITFAHLIQDVLINLELFTYLKVSTHEIIQRLIMSVSRWNGVPQKGFVSSQQLIQLLNTTMNELNHVKEI